MAALRLVLAFVAALVVFLVPTAQAVACNQLMSCDDCRDRTFCHWCSDGKCHAIGSISGCVYGTYCYNNDQCERQKAEYRGYAAPSIAVLLGVCLVGSTAIFCGMATISVAREYANQSVTSRASSESGSLDSPSPVFSRSREYMMLSGDDRRVNSEESPPESAESEKSVTTTRVGSSIRSLGRSRRGSGVRTESSEPSPLARKILNLTRLTCGAGIAMILIMCAMVVAFAPHSPGVNVCNTEFDWGSIVNSIKAMSTEADFQILVSVYNPNMLDAKIESGTAVFRHKHNSVGTMVFVPTLLAGGYVTDMLLTISFEAETWDELNLGWEYETGKLAFLMDATVSASVLWHGLKTYPFTFTIHNYYIKVSETTEYDRSLCNCSQMTQGTRDAIREVGEHVNASQPVILPLEGGEGEQYDE